MSALGYVLINLGDVSPGAEPGHAALLLDKRVRDMVAMIADGVEHSALDKLQSELITPLERALRAHAPNNCIEERYDR